MAKYSIKDLETLTGIKAHTIRIWEKRYHLVEPSRTSSNIRFYNDEDLKKLLNISTLNKNGLKISKIANLSNEELGEKILELTRQNNNFDGLIERLIVSMIDLDEAKFEKIVANATIKIGFEEVIFRIFFPLLEKIGVLWQTGAINPAQEHFISNLIKQKLLVAIDGLAVDKKTNYKTFVLFLPEWELHELGLLVYDYLIKKSGHSVIYLGQSVPLNDLCSTSDVCRPDILVTSFTTSVTASKIENLLNDLADIFKNKQILISGHQILEHDIKPSENISIIPNAIAIKEYLNKLD